MWLHDAVRIGKECFRRTRPTSRLEKEDEIVRCEAAVEGLREDDERLGPHLEQRGSAPGITGRCSLPGNCE